MNAMIDPAWSWLVPIIWGIGAFIIGVAVVAFGELLLCIREIALNTRKEGSDKEPKYHALPTIASILNAAGWAALVGGLIAVIVGVISLIVSLLSH
ncbi:MAG: hypothetical protein NZ930_01010 [Candidatus Bipolaricaulota bacterium]|nr:hypothetical protein [Candidatus Bipolaricaulota bacterium]MDW8031281.1 hypothetical protein [Candidatus Bipolaricaulota bacterium]